MFSDMSPVLFVESRGLPRWSPWTDCLGPRNHTPARCLWSPPRLVLKRPDFQTVADAGAKRPCRHQQSSEAEGFRHQVDVTGYRPDEVQVRVSDDGLVTVSARHQRRSTDGFVHSRMVKRVSVPKHVQADQLTCRLTSRGQLVLQAPPARLKTKEEKVLPVTMDNPVADGKLEDKKTDEIEVQWSLKTTEHVEAADGEGEEMELDAQEEQPQIAVQVDAEESDSDHEVREEAKSSEVEIVVSDGADSEVSAPPSPDKVESAAASNDRQVEMSGDGLFRVSVDVSAFRPEEVSVRVAGRQLLLEAEHEEPTPGGSTVLWLARRLTLPSAVDADLVTSRLTSRGQLVVEASASNPTPPTA